MPTIREIWRQYETDQLIARMNQLGLPTAAGLALKQDAATAATDAELAAAIAAVPQRKRTWSFSKSGVLAVATGAHRIYNDTGATITLGSVRSTVGTAPTGSALTTVLAKDGTALTTVNVPAAANTAATTGSFTWENGTYLTVNITAIGSTVAGSDLTVTLTEA